MATATASTTTRSNGKARNATSTTAAQLQAEVVETEAAEHEEVIEEDDGHGEAPVNSDDAPSYTLALSKVQVRMIGLLERTLGDDEIGKQRVLRSTAALLGIEIS